MYLRFLRNFVYLLACAVSVRAEILTGSNVITTVAGTDWNFRANGRPAVSAPISTPVGLGFDTAGSLLFADTNNHMISRIGSDGVLTVIAGNGIPGYSGEGGKATDASLWFPLAVAQDTSGNTYVSDSSNHIIRRISTDGTITVIAGQPRHAGYSGDGGPATNALLNLPAALTFDSSGNLYVMDFGNRRVRRITPQGVISTFAGNGTQGYSGDGDQAVKAALNMQDNGLVFDSSDNLYISDWANYRIRRVSSQGIITTVVGTGQQGFSGDGGLATQASISTPTGLAFDRAGNLYFADYINNRIRRVTPEGIISTVAGTGDAGFAGDGGPAVRALLRFPVAVAADPSGNLFISDRFNYRIRRVATDGTITTFAGNGLYRAIPDGSPASRAYFDAPKGIAFDSANNLYVADRNNNYVRRIQPDGTITTIAGNGSQGYSGDGGPATAATISYPTGITVDGGGNVYFAETFSNRVRRITPNGVISTVAGTGGQGFNGDNRPATQATLTNPEGLLVDSAGNLLITDYFNNRIRRVSPDGIITTIVGNGNAGFSGDAGPAVQAQLNFPRAIALTPAGELLIADTANNRVRAVSPQGTIRTVVGDGRAASSGDGGPASKASINGPTALLVDKSGNIYITENAGNRIRVVALDGTIATVAGTGTPGYTGDGGPGAQATLNAPDSGLALDGAGNLYLSDSGNNRIRVILAQKPSISANTQGTLAFRATSGGAATDAQKVRIQSSVLGAPFAAAVSTTSGGDWLIVDPNTGSAPGEINVTVDPAHTPVGSYSGTVKITSAATGATVVVPVTADITAARPAALTLSRVNVLFSFQTGSDRKSEEITISNGGDGDLSFSVAATTASGGPWLSVDPSSGSASASRPTSVTVLADPSGLAQGTYTGTLVITSSTTKERIEVPVNMTVSSASRQIVLSATGLTFTAVAGNNAPLPQSVAILNGRSGPLSWSATASTLVAGPAWLTLSQTSGTTDDANNPSLVGVNVDASGLAEGEYYGLIRITAEADNSPQFVSVLLRVLREGSSVGPDVRPTSLIFTGPEGSSPGSQTILVTDPSRRATSYTSTRTTSDGGNWLVHVPTDATLFVDRPTPIVVQADFSKLSAGINRGVITLVFNDGSSRTINVLSVVAPGQSSTAKSAGRAPAACTQSLVATINQPPDGFAGAAFQAVNLETRVVGSCDGAPLTVGAVVARMGSTTVNMTHRGAGVWNGTWTPVTQGQVKVAITALQGGAVQLVGTAAVYCNIGQVSASPFLAPGSVQNAASFRAGVPISPGAWISAFGRSLASDATVASESPLPKELKGLQVLLGGRQLPIYFANDGQVNAQVPYDLSVNTEHQVFVQRNGAVSVPQTVTVAAAQPGIFTTSQSGAGQAVIFGQNGKVVDSASPARAGDYVSIYAAGLGAVQPAVAEGEPAPSPPAVVKAPVTVTIGGKQADVPFAGLTPGVAGVYQINAVVPAGVTPGDAVPVVVSVSGQASPEVSMAVR